MKYPNPARKTFSRALPAAFRSVLLPLLLAWHAASEARAAGPAGKGPAWTVRDSSQAADFLQAIRRYPERIDSLTAGPGNFSQEKDLGFGYRLKEVWVNPAGKLGFTLKILQGSQGPVSFEVKPVMNYAGLASRYQAVLQGTFPAAGPSGPRNPGAPARSGDPAAGGAGRPDAGLPAFLPYYWNLPGAAAALPADSLGLPDAPPPAPVREALAYYMTPYSGTTYGIHGGLGGQLLENRDRFLGLGDTLMPDKSRALYLLRSLNPASRLTAAEFVIRHKAAFPDYEGLLAGPLNKVFSNPAKAETMRGDATSREDARKLVFEYAGREARRSGRGVFRQ